MSIENETYTSGVSELAAVTEYMRMFGMPEDSFRIDLTIARGLDYYTGTVYETQIKAHPEFGSVCSGGRYDNLTGYYTDKKLPGIGISIGLTRLFPSFLQAGSSHRKPGASPVCCSCRWTEAPFPPRYPPPRSFGRPESRPTSISESAA